MGWDQLAQPVGFIDQTYNFDSTFFNTFLEAGMWRNFMVSDEAIGRRGGGFTAFEEKYNELKLEAGLYTQDRLRYAIADIVSEIMNTGNFVKESIWENMPAQYDYLEFSDKYYTYYDYVNELATQLFADKEDPTDYAETVYNLLSNPFNASLADLLKADLWNAYYVIFKLQRYREGGTRQGRSDVEISALPSFARDRNLAAYRTTIDEYVYGESGSVGDELTFLDNCNPQVEDACPSSDPSGTGRTPEEVFAEMSQTRSDSNSSRAMSSWSLGFGEYLSVKGFDGSMYKNLQSVANRIGNGNYGYIKSYSVACSSYQPNDEDREAPISFSVKVVGAVTNNYAEYNLRQSAWEAIGNWPIEIGNSKTNTALVGEAVNEGYSQVGGYDEDGNYVLKFDELEYDDWQFVDPTITMQSGGTDGNGAPVDSNIISVEPFRTFPEYGYGNYDAPRLNLFNYGTQSAAEEANDDNYDPETDTLVLSGETFRDEEFKIEVPTHPSGNQWVLVDIGSSSWEYSVW